MPTKKPNELYITRVYDAPVSLVWDAWTDPKKAAKWWGPRGFTITTHAKDLRPGGFWSYTMHGPDGTDYENKTIYHEVKKHSLLVYDHGGNDDRPPLFRVTVRFEEIIGKTKMEMIMSLESEEAAKEIKKFIKQAGGNSTWDRLAEYLAANEGKDLFVINRSFDAPIELLFSLWTNAEHFSKWIPPVGVKMKFIEGKIKEGEKLHWAMEGDFGVMYGRFHYLEIKNPKKIVYTQEFCDENQNTSRHPLAPIWPQTMITTVLFSKEDEKQTRVTVTFDIYSEASLSEREAFHTAKPGMTLGWTGSFDKLEDLL
ncbi:MAG: SRPBCC domain-containing protein [Oligoflexia bacterium]|nr:SRPBCC domain-containing protein [Oligoflexia bacterium]